MSVTILLRRVRSAGLVPARAAGQTDLERARRATGAPPDLAGRSVTLKLKSSDFKLRTRSRSGLPATQLASRLFEHADALLKAELDGTRYRLIGISSGAICGLSSIDR